MIQLEQKVKTENVKRFIVSKRELKDAIVYLEYKNNGFYVKPKKKLTFNDMIEVDEMVVINQTLIDKLVSRKCKINLKRILEMTANMYDEEDDDNGDTVNNILDDIMRFRMLLDNKYKNYMDQKEYKKYLKKLEIIESEVKLKQLSRKYFDKEELKPKKGR